MYGSRFPPKIGETKLSSKQIKQDDDRNKDNKVNIIIHDFEDFSNFLLG
jgi:hypothetical protein